MFQNEMRYGCFCLAFTNYQNGKSSLSSVAEKSAGGTGADDTGGKE